MPPFIVDASMTLSWCFADEATSYSRGVLAALETTYAIVPALWPFEVANGLALAERRKRITQEASRHSWRPCGGFRFRSNVARRFGCGKRCSDFAREHRLPAYDAAYLDLAKREELRLATLDRDLQDACRMLGIAGVEV